MKKGKFTEEQIAYALRQVAGGTPVADVCRQIGVSDARMCVARVSLFRHSPTQCATDTSCS